MKTYKDRLLTYLLTPMSWLYGAAVYVRNKLFDLKLLKEEEFDVPVVCVGNITVGGTGKTPHVEYIVSHLSAIYKVAVLSRGYKRKTKGFILANSKSSPDSIGDEPYQIWHKFGGSVRVAVCEKRSYGIKQIKRLHPDVDLVILDDAFQHRYVKPRLSIVLIDYNRPVFNDHLLPLGRLRESVHALGRADMVVVTKCPDQMQPLDYRLMANHLELMAYQKLYFSRYRYEPLEPVFPEESPYFASISQLSERDSVLLLTGIAHPRYFVRHFSPYPVKVKVSHYPDHHDFSRNDLLEIERKFDEMSGERKIIITTEKDAVRLAFNPYFPDKLKPFVFFQPISVGIEGGIKYSDFISDLKTELRNKSVKDVREEDRTAGRDQTFDSGSALNKD